MIQVRDVKNVSRAKIKISRFVLQGIFLFFLVRIIIWLITSLLGVAPFLCYDDLYTYDKITSITTSELFSQLTFRNCYKAICAVLNQFRIGEYITGTRLLNVFLWLSSCLMIYKASQYLEFDSETSNRLFLFLCISPLYAIYSMSVLREVLCVWAICNVVILFLEYERSRKLKWIMILFACVILYIIRTGIFEVLAFVILIYEIRNKKWHVKVIFMLLCVIAGIYLLGNENYLYVINNKVDSYIYRESTGTGLLSKIEVKKIGDLYKLPILLVYVQMIPLPGMYEPYYDAYSWSNWVTLVVGMQSFFIPYFWFYYFKAKKSSQEKVIINFYIIILIVLALSQPNNSRFFFFTTPFLIMFGLKSLHVLNRIGKIVYLPGAFFALVPYLHFLL